jgi:hypothetical protein
MRNTIGIPQGTIDFRVKLALLRQRCHRCGRSFVCLWNNNCVSLQDDTCECGVCVGGGEKICDITFNSKYKDNVELPSLPIWEKKEFARLVNAYKS